MLYCLHNLKSMLTRLMGTDYTADWRYNVPLCVLLIDDFFGFSNLLFSRFVYEITLKPVFMDSQSGLLFPKSV